MQFAVALTTMEDNLIEKAIQAALEGNWKQAIELNLAVLQGNNQDIPALNRLGRAYTETNQIDQAENSYKQVLRIDSYNPIAKKNLGRLKSKKNISISNTSSSTPLSINSNFLEEPGKTKTTQLVRLADNEVLSGLHIGQKLILLPKKRTVCLKSEDDVYIGSLPDDLSYRLGKLLKSGNKYVTIVKSIESRSIQIFIREIYKSKRVKNTPSFPTTKPTSYNSDIRHAVLKQEPLVIKETGEED